METSARHTFAELLLSAISDAQMRFIDDIDTRELFGDLLERLLEITESEYGFIGEVLHKEGAPYLKTHAVTNIAWNKATRDFYEANIEGGLEFTNLSTLFGQVMVTGELVIANAPATDPRRGGLPDGHPALNAFLGLPFYKGDAMIGMLGLANRASGYDEALVDSLGPFLATCANIIHAHRQDRGRRRAEQELRASEEKMRAILRTAIDGIVTIDQTGRIESFNNGAAAMFGRAPEEVLGQNVSALMTARDAAAHDGYLQRYHETGERRVIGTRRELIGRRADGTEFPLELSISEVKLDGRTLYTGLITDITERKRAETQTNKLVRDLERSNRELQEFAYTASHDLKVPLRGIATLTTWLNADYAEKLDDEGKRLLALVKDRVTRLERTIEGLLSYARVAREGSREDDVDLASVARELVALLDPPPHVTVTIETLPVVRGNESQLRQLMQNLLSNAIHYADKQRGAVELIGCEDEDAWYLSVRDNGEGIAEKYHGKIFQMFKTLNSKEVDGSGIGLAIVKKIVDMHGGEIGVASSPGEGATFHVRVPRSASILDA